MIINYIFLTLKIKHLENNLKIIAFLFGGLIKSTYICHVQTNKKIEIMTTIKEILTENRDSIISSIKFIFKVWKNEDVKVKMIGLVNFINETYTEELLVERLLASKKIKTELKVLVQKMAISQMPKKDNRKWYEVANDIADAKGLNRCSLTGVFTDINGKVVNI